MNWPGGRLRSGRSPSSSPGSGEHTSGPQSTPRSTLFPSTTLFRSKGRLDLMMPRMNGWQVLDELAGRPPQERPLAIVLTGIGRAHVWTPVHTEIYTLPLHDALPI